jgi:transposase-like protein
MESLRQTLGVKEISKSQVSEMAKTPDELLEDLHQQPLEDGPYQYLWLDAMNLRCREGGRIVNVAAMTATAVNADGPRELPRMDVFSSDYTIGLRSIQPRMEKFYYDT